MRLTHHQHWGVGIALGVAGLTLLSALAGCATIDASAAYPGSEDTRRINLGANEINTGWKRYQAGVNACFSAVRWGALAEEDFAGCIDGAYQSSGFGAAVGNLRRRLEQVRDDLGSGECRSSLDQLATRLGVLSGAVTRLKLDADAARPSAYRADTRAITRAWDSAVKFEFAMTDACEN